MYPRPKFEYSTLSVYRIRILMTSFSVKMIVLSVFQLVVVISDKEDIS